MLHAETAYQSGGSLHTAVKVVLPVLLLLGLLAGGCGVGTYPVDYFPEMHYSPAYRVQEAPRLSPPNNSVPARPVGVTARLDVSPSYDLLGFAEIADVENPLPNTQETQDLARELYRINCAGCHGASGDGQTFVAASFEGNGVTRPINFAEDSLALSRTDGELFWIITHGTGDIALASDPPRGNMPAFRKFLSAQDRWALVYLINQFQGE